MGWSTHIQGYIYIYIYIMYIYRYICMLVETIQSAVHTHLYICTVFEGTWKQHRRSLSLETLQLFVYMYIGMVFEILRSVVRIYVYAWFLKVHENAWSSCCDFSTDVASHLKPYSCSDFLSTLKIYPSMGSKMYGFPNENVDFWADLSSSQGYECDVMWCVVMYAKRVIDRSRKSSES